MTKKFNSTHLNNIINELLISIAKSQKKASKFHESVTLKIINITQEIEKTQNSLRRIDNEINRTEKELNICKIELIKISKLLAVETDKSQLLYKDVYTKANDLREDLLRLRDEYKILFNRRDKLERELLESKDLLVDAKDLIQLITTSFKYLTNDLSDISNQLNEKEKILFKIIEASEIECKKIAREIHDGPAQTLAHLALEVQLLRLFVENQEKKEAINQISEIDNRIKEAIKETRGIIYNLRPMSLDDIGIIPTLENLIKDFKIKKNIQIKFILFDKNKLVKKLPPPLRLLIYRTIQESLNNIGKHANAKNVTIKLKITNNKKKRGRK